jgi:hypothetical protein
MHLEDKSRVNFHIECHGLNKISVTYGPAVPSQDVHGAQVTKFDLKSSEDCFLLPKALPANTKSKPNKANAASATDNSPWNLNLRRRKLGRVRHADGHEL